MSPSFLANPLTNIKNISEKFDKSATVNCIIFRVTHLRGQLQGLMKGFPYQMGFRNKRFHSNS